jgi:hypothetical protein
MDPREPAKSRLPASSFWFLLAAAGFLYFQLFLPNGTPIFMVADHWIFFEQAREMLQGKVLYRDIFQFTFPGAETVYAALLQVLGPKVWIPNAVLIALGVGLAGLTTKVSRSVLSGTSAWLPASLLVSLGFLFWHNATHHWFSALATMAGLATVVSGRDGKRLAAAGLFFGLATWFTQTQGGAALVGLAIYLVWEGRQKNQPWRRVLARESIVAGAFVSTVLATTAYFAWKAGLDQFLSLTMVFPAKYFHYQKPDNTPLAYMAGLRYYHYQWWERWPQAFFDFAVPLVYPFFFFTWRRRRELLGNEEKDRIMLVGILGAAMLAPVVSAPVEYRLCAVSPPALILLVWLVSSAPKARQVALSLLWFAVLLSATTATFTTARREQVGLDTLDLPTGRAAFLDHEWFHEFSWLRQHTAPGDYFFGGHWAVFYFPLELPPPSDVLYVFPNGYTRPAQVARLLGGLEAHKVRFLLWESEGERPQYFDRASDPLGPLRAYVQDKYFTAAEFRVAHVQILERR